MGTDTGSPVGRDKNRKRSKQEAIEALLRLTRQTRSPARTMSAKYATTTSAWSDTLPNDWAVHTPSARSASTRCTPGFTTSLTTPQRSRLERASRWTRQTQTPRQVRSCPKRMTTAVILASQLRLRPAVCATSSLSCPWWCFYIWASSLYIISITMSVCCLCSLTWLMCLLC